MDAEDAENIKQLLSEDSVNPVKRPDETDKPVICETYFFRACSSRVLIVTVSQVIFTDLRLKRVITLQ